MSRLTRILWVMVGLVLPAAVAHSQALAPQQMQERLEGKIRIIGSDSMDPLIRLWVQEFQKRQPKVDFQITSHGSGTAPPALTKGEAEIGAMSREMNAKELAAFTAQLGYAPTSLCVGFDALAIFVNRRNPLKRISIEQLDAIYSETRLAGWATPIRTWRDLAGQGWRTSIIRPYTRDEKSGTRALFMEQVAQKGGLLRKEIEVADQMGILEAIGQNVRAIGYGPTNYLNPQVRLVPLAAKGSQTPLEPTTKNIRTGDYALARRLYFYVNLPASTPLTPALHTFLKFVLSKNGQDLATGYGAVSLDPSFADSQASQLR